MLKLLIQGIGLILIPFICGSIVTIGLGAIECPVYLNGYWTACMVLFSLEQYQKYLKKQYGNR